jgi:hypothetical protein
MRRPTTPGLIITLVALTTAFAAWLYQWNRVRTISEELVHGQREGERATIAIAALQRNVEAAQIEMRKLQQAFDVTAARAAQAAASASPPIAGVFEIRQLFVEHPEWRSIYEASEKAAFLHSYAAFIASAGLSAEQRDQFATELMRHAEHESEAKTMARRHNWAPDDLRLLARQGEEQDRHAKELTSVLGETALRQLQQFESSLPVRPFVEELVERLYHTEQPLPGRIAEQVTESMARHAVNARGKVERGALDWDAALAEVRAVLAPEQFLQLQRIRETTELQNKMNQIVRRAARGH